MRDFFGELKKSFGMSAVISFVAGVLLLIFPSATSKFVCYLLGAIIIMQGISTLVNAIRLMKNTTRGRFMLVWSLILLGLGVFFIIRTDIIISIIPLIFGIFLLAISVGDILKALQLKNSKYEKWFISFLLAILKCVLAGIIIFNPFSTAVVMIMFIGVCLIYSAVSSLWTIYCISKNVPHVYEIIDKDIK